MSTGISRISCMEAIRGVIGGYRGGYSSGVGRVRSTASALVALVVTR